MQSDLPPGRGDERRLTQVLLNLVGNAIKFTDAGEVVIRAEASNGTFNLSVRDTGPGISAADQAKLFQEFQQADNPMTRKKEGTGLGLAISKRIIEMHGGRIWMEVQSEGFDIFRHTSCSGGRSKPSRHQTDIHVCFWHSADIPARPPCPLLGVKRTWRRWATMSPNDPKRT